MHLRRSGAHLASLMSLATDVQISALDAFERSRPETALDRLTRCIFALPARQTERAEGQPLDRADNYAISQLLQTDPRGFHQALRIIGKHSWSKVSLLATRLSSKSVAIGLMTVSIRYEKLPL